MALELLGGFPCAVFCTTSWVPPSLRVPPVGFGVSPTLEVERKVRRSQLKENIKEHHFKLKVRPETIARC